MSLSSVEPVMKVTSIRRGVLPERPRGWPESAERANRSGRRVKAEIALGRRSGEHGPDSGRQRGRNVVHQDVPAVDDDIAPADHDVTYVGRTRAEDDSLENGQILAAAASRSQPLRSTQPRDPGQLARSGQLPRPGEPERVETHRHQVSE